MAHGKQNAAMEQAVAPAVENVFRWGLVMSVEAQAKYIPPIMIWKPISGQSVARALSVLVLAAAGFQAQ